MTTAAQYRQHITDGLTHAQAVAKIGCNAATARTLKSRYTKQGATSEAKPLKVTNKIQQVEAGPVFFASPQTTGGIVSGFNIAGKSEENETIVPVSALRKLLGNTLNEKRQNLPHVERKPKSGINYRRAILYALLIAPTLASVQNAYHVSAQIMGDMFGAACLTVVLSVTALGFVAVGVRNWYTVPLALLLIGYESFCNLTRIYAGLMIGGKWGTSEFLGRVCDVFNSSSHYTAIMLGGITALLLAATQYASIFELSRK